MAASADQIWATSRASNSSLLVLLAIAHECGDDGAAEMSMPEIARKTRMSESSVRRAVRELEHLGELLVKLRSGVRSGYVVCIGDVQPGSATPVKMTGVPQSNRPGSATPVKMTGAVKMTGVEPETSRSEATPVKSTGVKISDALSSSTGREVVQVKETSEKPEKPDRLDVERTCRHLADRIADNGSKRPAITKKWRDAARLLMDKDGRSEDQVHTAIDWCQDDEFWRANVMSMPTLRDKYDRLRLDAIRSRSKSTPAARNGHQPTHEEFDALRENWARPLDEQEAEIDPRGNDQPDRVHRHRLPAAENR